MSYEYSEYSSSSGTGGYSGGGDLVEYSAYGGSTGGAISSLAGGFSDGGASYSYSSGGGGGYGGSGGAIITSGGGYSSGRADAMASDLLALGAGGGGGSYSSGAIVSSGSGAAYGGGYGGGSYSSGSYSSGYAGGSSGGQIYVSEVENNIMRASDPVNINESEEITVNGQRGIWANKAEVVNWRGVIPITQYQINEDSNPEIITKRSNQTLDYVQELAVRYLRPPTPPAPGEIIIQQQSNTLTPPAPPLIIRQQPARPSTPEPLVIREAPPQAPAQVGRKLITISGKRIPPPARKVIIERLAPLPPKPQSVIVERWLPYAQTKRRVIFQRAAQVDAQVVKPRNVIVQWEAPRVNIRREIKYLGVIRANPAEYVQRYGGSLKSHTDLPDYVTSIRAPDGLVLAANYRYNNLHELEGDIQALRLVDLDREGLAEYRSYLSGLGISYNPSAYESSSLGYSSRFGGSSGSLNLAGAGGGYSSSAGGFSSFGGSSGNLAYSSGGAGASSIAADIFNSINTNGDNVISQSEAERAFALINSRLGRNYTDSDVRSFFSRFDTNRDGSLSFEEFKRAILSWVNF